MSADPRIDEILAYKFTGAIFLKTWENKYLDAFPFALEGQKPGYFDHCDVTCLWELGMSPRGIYCISTTVTLNDQRPKRYYMQCDMGDRKLIKLHDGCDDWESFWVERQGDEIAFKNMASNGYLCAEPSSHSIHLIADRQDKGTWETFYIEFLNKEGTGDQSILKSGL